MRIEVRGDSVALTAAVSEEIQRRSRLALARVDRSVSVVRVVISDGEASDHIALVSVRVADGPEIRIDAHDAMLMDAVDRALDRVSRAALRWIELRHGVSARKVFRPVS